MPQALAPASAPLESSSSAVLAHTPSTPQIPRARPRPRMNRLPTTPIVVPSQLPSSRAVTDVPPPNSAVATGATPTALGAQPHFLLPPPAPYHGLRHPTPIRAIPWLALTQYHHPHPIVPPWLSSQVPPRPPLPQPYHIGVQLVHPGLL